MAVILTRYSCTVSDFGTVFVRSFVVVVVCNKCIVVKRCEAGYYLSLG